MYIKVEAIMDNTRLNFKQIESQEKEKYLWITHLFCVDILSNTLMKICTFNMFTFLSIFLVVQTYIFLRKFEFRYFLQYAPIYIGSYYFQSLDLSPNLVSNTHCVLVGFVAQLKNRCCGPNRCYEVLMKNFDFWKTDAASKSIEKRIKFESYYLDFVLVVTLTLAFTSSVLFLIPHEDDNDFIFIYVLFEKYLSSDWAFILNWATRISYLFLPVIMLQPMFLFFYAVSKLKFQMYMLNYYVDKINSGYEGLTERELIFDEQYQREIEERLKFCIKRHRRFSQLVLCCLRELQYFIFLFALNGVTLAIAMIAFYFTTDDNLEDKRWRLGTLLVAGIITFIHCVQFSQEVTDVTSDFYEALKRAEWYYWDKKNLKIYSIFLLNTQDPIELKFTDNGPAGYELGVAVMKTAYSIASVLSQVVR